MINLITGGPGSGKTCLLIGELLKYQKEGRHLYVHGVPGLTIDHTRVYCESPSCTVCEDKPKEGALYAKDWTEFVNTGDVVIIDEVQHVWRPRGARVTEVPRGIASLETSRHLGVDFWFVTQNPSLVDVHVRRMVTRHQHIKYSPVYGRVKFEWSECQTDPQQTWTPDTVKSTYRLNKKHYPYYKSADLHTKQSRKLPTQVYFYGAIALVFPFVVYKAVTGMTTLDERMGIAETETESPVQSDPAPTGFVSSVVSGRSFSGDRDARADPFDREPVDPLKPESAPAFRHLVEIKDYPRVAACIWSEAKNICQCYTQQATRVVVPYQQCRNFVDNPPFNPYLPPQKNSSPRPVNSSF